MIAINIRKFLKERILKFINRSLMTYFINIPITLHRSSFIISFIHHYQKFIAIIIVKLSKCKSNADLTSLNEIPGPPD